MALYGDLESEDVGEEEVTAGEVKGVTSRVTGETVSLCALMTVAFKRSRTLTKLVHGKVTMSPTSEKGKSASIRNPHGICTEVKS
jgi:hypothetical protein